MEQVIKERIKNNCIKNEFEFESFDFEGEYDNEISYKENIIRIAEEYPNLEFLLRNKTVKKLQIKADKELIEREVNKEYQKQIQEDIKKEIKKAENITLKGIYEYMEKLTSVLLNSPQKCLLVNGEAGLGKTYTIRNKIRKEKVNLEYISGNITHKGFINRLNDISNTTVKTCVLLDDIDNILTDKGLIATLKGLLSNEITIYETNNEKIVFKPNDNIKFILIANKYPHSFEAIIDRSIFCEVKLNYYEKIAVMKELIKIPYGNMSIEQQKEVFEFIDEKTNPATKNFSLRTLFKGFNVFISQKENYKDCLIKLFESDERVLLVEKLIKDNTLFTEKEKAQEFNNITNLSTRTYYRIKAEIPQEIKVLTN